METVDITPNYAGMRNWLKEVAKTDLIAAVNVNEEMGSEGLDRNLLVEIFNEWNPKQPAMRCPRCETLTVDAPGHTTHEGAAEFYCDGCETFWKDFDYWEEINGASD